MISRGFSILAGAIVLLATLAGCAANKDTTKKRTELPQPSREFDFKDEAFEKTFDNGITLFVVPDQYTRLVEFDVRQQVGTREDPPGKAGMAHFVEHLMFQMPADGPGTPKLMSVLPQHTLFFNAYTSYDETHYMHGGPSDELENYFKYTALRLNYDCDAVPEDEFLREREVVRNEHRWRGEGFDAFVFDKISELAFPEGHPYRRPVLYALDKETASITPKEACDFVKRYYTASQAQVVITGDVDPLKALALAKQYLEPLPKINAPPRKPVPPAELPAGRHEVKAPVKHPTAVVMFQVPKRFSKQYAAASAAIQTMVLSVEFFRRYKPSVIERSYPMGTPGKEARLIGMAIETRKARDLDRGIDEVLSAINRGFQADLKGRDYQGSYDSIRQRTRLFTLSSISGIFSRSGAYADYLEAKAGFFRDEIDAVDALTPEQIQETGRRIFSRDAAMIIKVVPDGSNEKPKAERAKFDYKPNEDEELSIPEDIDPAEAHKPLPITDIAPPEGQSVEMTLDNGMRVVLVQSSSMPVMDIQLVVGAGRRDAPERAELAGFVGRFYGPREGERDAMNLMSFFDLAGGIFDFDVTATSTTYVSRGMSIYLDFVIAGFAERTVQAEYQTRALEGWKDNRREQLKKYQSVLQPLERMNEYFAALYGPDHPHVQRVLTDPSKIKAITLNDLEEFRSTYYRADNSALIITGGFDMDLAIQYVEAYFGNPKLRNRKNPWMEPKSVPDRPTPPEPKPGNIRVLTQVDPERVTTDVQISFALNNVYGDDHAELAVLGEMLNTRVQKVRQKLGASYGVNAGVDTERPRIAVGGAIDGARAAEGFGVIRESIEKLRNGDDFDRQFAFARRKVLKSMINDQADPERLASRLAQAVRNGRSYDYFQNLAQEVAKLEPAQVKAMIDRVLKDERSVTSIVGSKDGIESILSTYKLGEVKKLPDIVHDEEKF